MPRVVHFAIPNWSAISRGWTSDSGLEAAVVADRKVVGLSRSAFELGIRIGMSTRSARGRSHTIALQERDPIQELRRFFPVQQALTSVSPYFRYVSAGSGYLHWSSVGRYFGSEEKLVRAIREAITGTDVVDGVEISDSDVVCGAADGYFAATLAAGMNLVVPPGATREFMDAMPVSVLGDSEMLSLLPQLGIKSIANLLSMRVSDISTRFGSEGIALYRLALGEEEVPDLLQLPDRKVSIESSFEQPIREVEPVVFSAIAEIRAPVTELLDRGMVVTSAEVTTITSKTSSSRSWTLFSGFDERSLAERVRWQLEGMMNCEVEESGWDGVVGWRVDLIEFVPSHGSQLDLLGTPGVIPEGMTRAMARAEAILGPDSLVVPVAVGARSPDQTVDFLPWQRPVGEVSAGRKMPARSRGSGRRRLIGSRKSPIDAQDPPWPGGIADPRPAAVYLDRPAVELLDQAGSLISLSGRGELHGVPFQLNSPNGSFLVRSHLGPWLVEQRWWDDERSQRYGRLLLLLHDGSAYLVVVNSGRWFLEAIYD